MENLYKEILSAIGEDVSREGLRDTPRRAAKAMRYLTKGYQEDLDKIVNNALFAAESDDMVIVRDIELYSLCEHHLLPFIGKCHVGYIPTKKIIGLSKIPRIVEVYARRLQVQERLTKQIADTILKYTQADGVGVVIEAQHLCTMMRGVEKQNSVMTTSCMLGSFRRESATRAEFMALIKKSNH
jgi:GTP cyclohydrolase I